MRERDIEEYLVQRVKAMGGEVRKVKWIGRIGAPDRLLMLPHKTVECAQYGTVSRGEAATTIWVELKAPGAKARPSQLREHDRMRSMGQNVLVVDSLEGVEALLS